MLVVLLVLLLGLLVFSPATLLSLAFLPGPSVTFFSSFPLFYDLENSVIAITRAAVVIILIIVVTVSV